MLRALDTWWLEVDPERKREMHQNEPEAAQHEGPGMPPGGNNTTASEFQDIEHHPGPILEITAPNLQHRRTRSITPRSITTPEARPLQPLIQQPAKGPTTLMPPIIAAATMIQLKQQGEEMIKCSSCNTFHKYHSFKTCGKCIRKKRDKAERRAEARRASKAEDRIGKRYCGTENWCPPEDFNMHQRVCRPHQAHARERRKLARTQKHSSQRRQTAINLENIAEPNAQSSNEHSALGNGHKKPKLLPVLGTTVPAVDTIAPNLLAPTNGAALPTKVRRSRTELEMNTAVSQKMFQRRIIMKHQMRAAAVTCCMPKMEVKLPSVESTSTITVCWNEEKKWHVRAAADIPTGTLIAIYPLTIKMQPS